MCDREQVVAIPLAKLVSSYVKSLGYGVAQADNGRRLEFAVRAASAEPWQCHMVVYEDSRVLRIFVSISEPYPLHRSDWIRTLVAVANEELAVFGHFVRSDVVGLYYSCASCVAKEDLPIDAVDELMNRIVFPVEIFARAMRRVSRRKVSPVAALEAALIEGEARDLESAGRNARKALLTLIS